MSTVIEVKGGIVQAVYSNSEHHVFIIDYDNDTKDHDLSPIECEPISDKLAKDINLKYRTVWIIED